MTEERRLRPRESMTPGPRTLVRLDIAEAALPDLLAGVDVASIQLFHEGEIDGDDIYSLRATQTLGVSRKQVGVPAIDLLTDLMNELGEALEAEDVPQRLRDLWDDLLGRYEARTRDPASASEASS